jgi:GntR family transcriptional regulator
VTRQPDTGGAGSLDLAIDREAEVPIGVQLAWALRAHIYDGRLTAGQRLPGLRDLAQALKINANTVRAVYQRLEHEGMIESHQGSGTYVTATARKSATAGAIAASAAREAHQTGVDPREVAAALYVEAASQAQPRDQTAERRRELRTQIAALEQVLGKIEAEHPGLVPASRARVVRGPRLLDVEELELTQNHLIRRLAAIQAARDALRDEHQPPIEQTHEAPAPPQRAARRAKTRPAPAGA